VLTITAVADSERPPNLPEGEAEERFDVGCEPPTLAEREYAPGEDCRSAGEREGGGDLRRVRSPSDEGERDRLLGGEGDVDREYPRWCGGAECGGSGTTDWLYPEAHECSTCAGRIAPGGSPLEVDEVG